MHASKIYLHLNGNSCLKTDTPFALLGYERNFMRHDRNVNGGKALSQQPLVLKSKIIGVDHSGERRAVSCVLGPCLSVYLSKPISDAWKAKNQSTHLNPWNRSRLKSGAQSKRIKFNTRKHKQGGAHS